MVRKFIVICLLVQLVYGDKKIESEKSVSKRGILHLNIHGHHIHTPNRHVHAINIPTPHIHVAPHVHHVTPHFHIPTPHVHHHVIPKVPVVHKPVVPVIPTTPYHIHHGGATVTSFNVNYPKYPVVKSFVPAVIPPHHHGFYPHFHIPKPIIPVAVPVPAIRVPKYPVFIPQKPIFIHSKPQFVPPPPSPPTASFLPIPIPSVPVEAPQTPVHFTPAGTSEKNPIDSCNDNKVNLQQQQAHSQGSWIPISNFMLTRPTQNKFSSPPYNYHAHKSQQFNDDDNNLYKKMMKNFQVSGQGGGVSGQQQLAHYLASQQLIHQEPQSNNFLIKLIFFLLRCRSL